MDSHPVLQYRRRRKCLYSPLSDRSFSSYYEYGLASSHLIFKRNKPIHGKLTEWVHKQSDDNWGRAWTNSFLYLQGHSISDCIYPGHAAHGYSPPIVVVEMFRKMGKKFTFGYLSFGSFVISMTEDRDYNKHLSYIDYPGSLVSFDIL